MTHTPSLSYTSPSGTQSISFPQTGDSNFEADFPIATGSSAQIYPVVLDLDFVKSLYLYSTVGLLLKANDAFSPDYTITLQAGKALIWHLGGTVTNPVISESGTNAFYAVNQSGPSVAGTFIIRSLHQY